MLTKEQLQDKISQGVRFLDGATGSNLMKAGMPRGGCTEKWILENPDALIALQRQYAKAGSDILYAPTFQAQPIALEKVGLGEQTETINAQLVSLSRKACPDKLIAGDLTTLATFTDSWDSEKFDLLVENYRAQIRGLLSPPFRLPGRNDIPDHNQNERSQELVDEGIGEHAPGDDFVSGGIFRCNTDHFLENVAEAPFERGLFFVADVVNTAVQHSVKVEGSFVGHKRTDDVDHQTEHHDDEVDFNGVDGELVRRHSPDDPGFKRSGAGSQKFSDRNMPVVGDQPGINRRRPVALQENERERKNHTGNQRTESTGGISESAVKSENDHGTGTDPHGADDGDEHIHIVQLGHEERSDEPENTAGDGNRFDDENVLFCGQTGFHEGDNAVLSDGLRRREQTGVVR